jgi:hypothetical protein
MNSIFMVPNLLFSDIKMCNTQFVIIEKRVNLLIYIYIYIASIYLNMGLTITKRTKYLIKKIISQTSYWSFVCAFNNNNTNNNKNIIKS